MTSQLDTQQRAYADLIICGGVNLQPGQALHIVAELGHRDMVRLLVARAYDAGASYVSFTWLDPLSMRARYQHIDPKHLDFVPEYEVARRRELLANGWAYIALTGSEYPDAMEDVDPDLRRREQVAWYQKVSFWHRQVMNNEIRWCVAAVPTAAWAIKVFPQLPEAEATSRLWQLVMQVCRADQPDPLQAWAEHDHRLKQVAAFMDHNQVRSIRYLDETPAPDGRAWTDLTVGLTDRPAWSCGSAMSKVGLPFYANIPTEEVFSTPHRDRVQGWARTSKPGFPFEREVSGAYFRFEDGQLVQWSAKKGQEVLDQLFDLDGARQLGELSLVDVRSPINQTGLIFHDTLFDENAVSHIAFGSGYPEGLQGGNELTQEELQALGMNSSDTHIDLMIGTEAMQVIATCADGRELLVMKDGQFTTAVTEFSVPERTTAAA